MLEPFVPSLKTAFPKLNLNLPPWLLVADVEASFSDSQAMFDLTTFRKQNLVWIHPSASIEDNVQIRGFAVIGEGCFIAANSYLRSGVILGPETHIGPGVELKSVICAGHSAFAHLNYIGNSVIGMGVNFEAGAIVANHLNEAKGSSIKVRLNQNLVDTGVLKFGAVVGDNCKIGANAVLSPGTLLEKATVVPRLSLIEQVPLAETL